MEKKILVTLISVVAVFLVFSSMSNPVAAETETSTNPVVVETDTATEPVLAQLSQPLQSKPLPAQVQLINPATKQIIGYYDRIKKLLVFTVRRLTIPRNLILRVSNKEYNVLMQQYNEMARTNLKYMDKHVMQTYYGCRGDVTVIYDGVALDGCRPPGGTGGGGGTTSSDNCVGLCWYMAEGGAYCRGCCTPTGPGLCFCWEECSDYMSSIAQ